NHFHQAGGTCHLIQQLLEAGLLHDEVTTVLGEGLHNFTRPAITESDDEYQQDEGDMTDDDWGDEEDWGAEFTDASGEATETQNTDIAAEEVIASPSDPFAQNGGIHVLKGNLGRAIMKTSAIKPDQHVISAPAKLFHSQQDLLNQYQEGLLQQDFVAVLLFQGPKANGMPELHKLMTVLANLQDEGYRVALLTDGRLSGASGKVPAAIHLSPEALDNEIASKIEDGDNIIIDADNGILHLDVKEMKLTSRTKRTNPNTATIHYGLGRELFTGMRHNVTSAEEGASFILPQGLDQ
ncbi:MAG: dihydroxy-acid dehydratase, partial [Rickettsiales bacterium]|nr:dihydroxy-acid dehydratase [Rickettsiales bacterium]